MVLTRFLHAINGRTPPEFETRVQLCNSKGLQNKLPNSFNNEHQHLGRGPC